MKIRLEKRTDYKQVENTIREAFWNKYRPGCYEHFIVHNLRHDPTFIPQLDYVIEENNKIIGHIAYSKNKIETKNQEIEAVTLGPISILPEYQKQGYGTQLINYTLNKAKKLKIPYIFVIGNKKYYKRFGFQNAGQYNIKFNDFQGDTEFFMIKILDQEKTGKIEGIYRDNPLFTVDENELEQFDQKFPEKTKEKHEGQLNF